MGEFSLSHILILLIILLIFFGPKRLPDLGRSMGKAINDFKKGMNDSHDEEKREKAQELQASSSRKVDANEEIVIEKDKT
jgi:sec-independent protein translocase protein TatA